MLEVNLKTREAAVLVIEDDDIDFRSIQRSLRKSRVGNQLIRARDGAEAFEMLAQKSIKSPLIILLDLQMPRMGGLEFLKELRTNPKLASYSKSVVFVLTTSDDENDIVESYKDYVAGYFVKDETGVGFLEIAEMLEGYWKIVHLPEMD